LKNSVELIDCYGSDERHALSAWTSTSRDITEEKRSRIPKLLKFLAENEHTTPFEKSFISFLVVCDTASHIHLLKHRIGVSINGESARYKELMDDKYYVPDDWPEHIQSNIGLLADSAMTSYHSVIYDLTNRGVDRKRAKESARYVLPYATQVTLDVSFNFQSFMHFQKLRNAPDAQKEIREIAQEMLRLVQERGNFKYSLEAYGYGISETLE
jgi:thymidylate synthase (FAD)